MTFSDFVESVLETPICCESKQQLDKWHELYVKNPEKCIEKMSTRGSAKSNLFTHLLVLLTLYEKVTECGRFVMKKEDEEIMQALNEFFMAESEDEE